MDITKEMTKSITQNEYKFMISMCSYCSQRYGKTFENILRNRVIASLEDFLTEVEYFSVFAPTPEISDTLEHEAFRLCKLVLKYRKFRGMI